MQYMYTHVHTYGYDVASVHHKKADYINELFNDIITYATSARQLKHLATIALATMWLRIERCVKDSCGTLTVRAFYI